MSRSISQNVKWGIKESFKKGRVVLPYKRFLGYQKGNDGKIEIVESEAEVVRKIYGMYLEGNSTNYIVKYLNDKKYKSPGGNDKWYPQTVKSILTNEKYKGDALLQKIYVVDYLTHEKRQNNGEVQQYYV